MYLGIPLELYKDETMNEDTDIIVLNNLIKFTIKLDTGVYDKELEYLFTSIMRSFCVKVVMKKYLIQLKIRQY